MGTDSSSEQSKQRGFNLVEAAIVLGVVGLIIGGIWVASAAVYNSYKINKTVEDLAVIVKNIQNLISFRDAENITNNATFASTLISAGVFPKEWIIDGNTIRTPFGANVTPWNLIGVSGVNGTRFDLSMRNISVSECAQLAVKISSQGLAKQYLGTSYWKDTLGQIKVASDSGGGVAWKTFPISPREATTACQSMMDLGGIILVLTYGYTRIN